MGLLDSEKLNMHTKFETIQLTMDKIQKNLGVFATPERKTGFESFCISRKRDRTE